jgi:hypothetical protein
MYKLTSEQKLANYEELIAAKTEKVVKLAKEIKSLEAKAAKLRTSLGVQTADSPFAAAINTMADC